MKSCAAGALADVPLPCLCAGVPELRGILCESAECTAKKAALEESEHCDMEVCDDLIVVLWGSLAALSPDSLRSCLF